MFKPTHFRLLNAIHWPGAGPTTEIHADNIREMKCHGQKFTFVHASGHAVEVPSSEVTTYGIYDDENVPNMPSADTYKDGTNDSDNDSDDTDDDDGTSDNSDPSDAPANDVGLGVDDPSELPDNTDGSDDNGSDDSDSDDGTNIDAPADESGDTDAPVDAPIDAPTDDSQAPIATPVDDGQYLGSDAEQDAGQSFDLDAPQDDSQDVDQPDSGLSGEEIDAAANPMDSLKKNRKGKRK